MKNKMFKKHINGILLGNGLEIAKKRLKDAVVGSEFTLTAMNGWQSFKKISENEIKII